MTHFEHADMNPTDEELKKIADTIEEETPWSFFTPEPLAPEEQKNKILERWQLELTKSGGGGVELEDSLDQTSS